MAINDKKGIELYSFDVQIKDMYLLTMVVQVIQWWWQEQSGAKPGNGCTVLIGRESKSY